jgi:uncharacterized small protein (DUF1192 family)
MQVALPDRWLRARPRDGILSGAIVQTGGNRMDIDDLDPRARPGGPKPLDRMSVGDLEEYVAALEAEAARAKAAIAARKGHRSAADSLFKL